MKVFLCQKGTELHLLILIVKCSVIQREKEDIYMRHCPGFFIAMMKHLIWGLVVPEG